MLRKVRLPMCVVVNCNAERKVGKGLFKAAMEINAGRSGDFAQDSAPSPFIPVPVKFHVAP